MTAEENFRAAFPEGLSTLKEADNLVYSIIRDEEERQWCVLYVTLISLYIREFDVVLT